MIRKLQSNFTNGAISQVMHARVDHPSYQNSAKTIENCKLLPQGGVTRRPGTFMVGEVAYSDAQVEEFVFSSTQAYTFFLSEGRLDIWDKNAIAFAQTLTGLPWTATHVANTALCCTQALDTMLISNQDFATVVIKRYGPTDFRVEGIAFPYDGNTNFLCPFHKFAPTDSTLQLSGAGPGAGITATCSVAYFTAGHVGTNIRYKGQQMAIVSLVGAAPATTVNVYVRPPGIKPHPDLTPDLGPDPEWDEEAIPGSGIHGWIKTTAFHEQRLVLGGTRDLPNTLWLSQTNQPFNFDLGTGLDSEAIKETIYADRVVEIRALVSMGNLQIFCGHGEFIVPWGGQNALTPANFSVKQQSGYGIKMARARRFDQATVFVTRVANSVREFAITTGTWVESYAADSMTFMAEGIVRSPKSLDTQMEGIGSQQAICYVTNSDGTLAVLTKVKKESIGGWLLWTTAGTFQRIGIVDRQGWTLTRRNIAGTWRNFIEVFDDDWRLDAAISAVFGSPTSHVGPFPLYVGQSVTAITGDLYIGEFVVDSTGYIDLPLEVSQVEIGLNFVPRVVPLQMEVPLADGISYGKPKRYVRTIADILDTASIRVAGRTLNTSQPDTDPGAPTPTRTGQFEVWHLGWHVQPDIEITSPLPLPFTMRGLMIEVEV